MLQGGIPLRDLFEGSGPLLVATAIIWLSTAVVALIGLHAFVSSAAVILALLSTITIWSLWAMDRLGIELDDGSPREKSKRSVDEDARLSLLLAVLTPDERSAVRARLAEQLEGDGESLSLADLLADQEADESQTGHAS